MKKLNIPKTLLVISIVANIAMYIYGQSLQREVVNSRDEISSYKDENHQLKYQNEVYQDTIDSLTLENQRLQEKVGD